MNKSGHYLGDKKLDLESNWKLKPILDLLRKNSSVGVNDGNAYCTMVEGK